MLMELDVDMRTLRPLTSPGFVVPVTAFDTTCNIVPDSVVV